MESPRGLTGRWQPRDPEQGSVGIPLGSAPVTVKDQMCWWIRALGASWNACTGTSGTGCGRPYSLRRGSGGGERRRGRGIRAGAEARGRNPIPGALAVAHDLPHRRRGAETDGTPHDRPDGGLLRDERPGPGPSPDRHRSRPLEGGCARCYETARRALVATVRGAVSLRVRLLVGLMAPRSDDVATSGRAPFSSVVGGRRRRPCVALDYSSERQESDGCTRE